MHKLITQHFDLWLWYGSTFFKIMYCISKEDHEYIKVPLEIFKSIDGNTGCNHISINAPNPIFRYMQLSDTN